jgi:8-oxo-dGTP pyrophosphatase MutT (NUDIX family)
MSDGSTAVREVVVHPGAVAIVAIDADDQVVMVNQYRHPIGRTLDELPAGLMDVPGEAPLAAARRELFEEAGLNARRWDLLLDLHTSPGMTDELIRVFLARELSEVDLAERFVPEAEEITMTVHRVPLAKAAQQALSGAITNGVAVAGILAASVAAADNWRSLRGVGGLDHPRSLT